MSNQTLFRSSIFGFVLLASAMLPAADFRVSGPYTHDNLSIYLLHSAGSEAGKTFLTLQEAMEQQKVVVYETGQVNQLAIENRSAEEIYIQSGDIVKGGRQDRVLSTDLVLPPHSGKLPIASFCVEHGRWTRRGNEEDRQFSTSNQAVAFKDLKMAVRNEKDQSRVWAEVANAQARLGAASGTGAVGGFASASPTSMQLALENRNVVDAAGAYVRTLARIADGQDDVVGYAYAINGKLDSADAYASHDLFRRMWPKMLQSSATEAVGARQAAKTFSPPDVSAVKGALAEADRGREASKENTGRVTVAKKESEKVILFEASDRDRNGEWLHKSYVVK